jgi:hypothetical protein
MLDVFRFAWFVVRTFFGVIALVLTLYAALWLFVHILSAAPANADPHAAPRDVVRPAGNQVQGSATSGRATRITIKAASGNEG